MLMCMSLHVVLTHHPIWQILLAWVILATFFNQSLFFSGTEIVLSCQTSDLFYWWHVFAFRGLVARSCGQSSKLVGQPNRQGSYFIKLKHIITCLSCSHICAKYCSCLVWHAADTKASWFQEQEFGARSMDRNQITSMGYRCTTILEI